MALQRVDTRKQNVGEPAIRRKPKARGTGEEKAGIEKQEPKRPTRSVATDVRKSQGEMQRASAFVPLFPKMEFPNVSMLGSGGGAMGLTSARAGDDGDSIHPSNGATQSEGSSNGEIQQGSPEATNGVDTAKAKSQKRKAGPSVFLVTTDPTGRNKVLKVNLDNQRMNGSHPLITPREGDFFTHRQPDDEVIVFEVVKWEPYGGDVEMGVAKKLGLAKNLPPDHPYYSANIV